MESIQRISNPQSLPPLGRSAQSAAMENPPPASADRLHISAQSQRGHFPVVGVVFNNTEEKSDPAQEFGTAVRVDADNYTRPRKYLFWMEMTPSQENKLKAAEMRHFSRFEQGYNRLEQGSISHKIRQSQISTFNPGYLELLPTMLPTEDEEKRVQRSLQDYGIEMAAIGFTGKNEDELKNYLEDKFFLSLFNRDKREFEEYFKGGFNDFVDDMFGRNAPENEISGVAGNTAGNSDSTKNSPYRWRFFRPSLGATAKGLDYQAFTLKPKVELVKMQGPAATELRLSAEVPINMKGEYEPEFELKLRRILFHKPGQYGSYFNNIFIESRSQYEMMDFKLKTTLGIRKQFGPDNSLGLFGMYSQTFDDQDVKDLGVGLNYQIRFK